MLRRLPAGIFREQSLVSDAQMPDHEEDLMFIKYLVFDFPSLLDAHGRGIINHLTGECNRSHVCISELALHILDDAKKNANKILNRGDSERAAADSKRLRDPLQFLVDMKEMERLLFQRRGVNEDRDYTKGNDLDKNDTRRLISSYALFLRKDPNKEVLLVTSDDKLKRCAESENFSTISVDKFCSDGDSDATYLLSHFHTDHMKGLSHSWNSGVIICEEVTQALLIQKYGPNFKKRSMSLSLFQSTPLLRKTSKTLSRAESQSVVKEKKKEETLTLYLLPALHIPGSVMFFLETPFGNILYTGDFKYDEQARRLLHPFFANHCVDHVYVDDTWLHLGIREVSLSSNGNEGTRVLSKMLSESELEEAIEAVGRRMDKRLRDFSQEKDLRNSVPSCGAYVLRIYLHNQFGKEHLVQRIAARLGIPVLVDKVRYERLCLLASFNEIIARVDEKFCVDINRFMPYENSKIFPRIEVVSSLKDITPEALQAAAERNGGTPYYGIVMSGWALLRRRSSGGGETTVWEIPTTLHSTPQQIIDFIAMLRPMSVTPLHYKACRGEIVLQRLGPFLRRPYVNQFLSVSDNLMDDKNEWRRCLFLINDDVEPEPRRSPQRCGFRIAPPSTWNSPSHVSMSFPSQVETSPSIGPETRKRPPDISSSSLFQTISHEDLLSSSSSTFCLSQLAELLDP